MAHAMSTSGIPDGYSTLTPSLNLRGANEALVFYQNAFNAVERFRMPDTDGGVMHGEFQIGDSIVMFCDEDPAWGAVSPETVGGCPLSLNLYVPDCDALTVQAVAAGAELLRPPTTYPWGERSAMLRDPFGFRWAVCTHVEDVAPEEIQRRMATWNPETNEW
jgi:PhnB protein